MTLKQLEVFYAVAQSRSFSKGAERTCITQSTASQHIQALEDELGIRLFDRGRGGVHLTEGGKLFLEHAARVLGECERTLTAVRRFRGQEGVVLRVGASTIPATFLIPRVLAGYRTTTPGVRLQVVQGDTDSVLRQLVEEEVELGLVGGGVHKDERIRFEPIGEDSIVCVVDPVLAGGTAVLEAKDLSQVPLLVREEGSGTQQAVDRALAELGVSQDELQIVAVLGSSEAVRRALLNGSGYAFVSRVAVAEDLENGRLCSVTVAGLDIRRTFYIVHRANRQLSPAAEAFRSNLLHNDSCIEKRD